MSRRFDRSELAFFSVPRTWREIEMRFGSEAKTEPFRDCIILADNEGGTGYLRYLKDKKSWVLTDMGKQHVGERLIARELRVYPDPREREAAGEAFNEAFDPFADLLAAPGPLEGTIVTEKTDEKVEVIETPKEEIVIADPQPPRPRLSLMFDAMGGGTPCDDCGMPLAMGCSCGRG